MNTSIGFLSSLNNDTVAVRIKVASWEEAVDYLGSIMENAGLTHLSYTKAMKDTLKSLGPYSVITPGIAMPHARPEDGVIRTGFALITLETPVNFGSAENDPVDIVIGLAALDKYSHITALREIATCLGDSRFVQDLRNARTKKDMLMTLDSKRTEK